MRQVFFLIFLALSLTVTSTSARSQDVVAAPPPEDNITLPTGTKVLLVLKSGIGTDSARPGDNIYLQTSFPVTEGDRIVIPAGAYVRGVIDSVKRPGRVKGRAQVGLHFTTLIFNNGYTLPLPGTTDNVPGAENSKVKDNEGTIQAKGQKGKDAGTVAGSAATGGLIGGLSSGGRGAGIGSAIGGVVGLAAILLTRGDEIHFPAGTPLEMVLQRPIVVDINRVPRGAGESEIPAYAKPGEKHTAKPVAHTLTPLPEPR